MDEAKLLVFERHILRKKFVPVGESNAWRIRKNMELMSQYGGIDVFEFIKLGRLQWTEHVKRMDSNKIPKKVQIEELHGKRRVEKPNIKCLDPVSEDSRILLSTQNWTSWIIWTFGGEEAWARWWAVGPIMRMIYSNEWNIKMLLLWKYF